MLEILIALFFANRPHLSICVSSWKSKGFEVLDAAKQVLPGSNECSILVTNMAKTFSEGHKLKLAALLISSDLDIKSITPAFFEQGIARAKEGYREG